MRGGLAVAAALSAAASAAATAHDYVVVGAGAAGCPLAAKLAKGGKTVLLIEAGPDDDWTGPTCHPLIPAEAVGCATAPAIDDQVMSEPVWKKKNNRTSPVIPGVPSIGPIRLGPSEFMPRARVVGGCTMHNEMIFLRGSPEVYDAWGADEWAWETVKKKFVAMENHVAPGADDGYHGHDGECYVSNVVLPDADNAFIDAARGAGHPRNTDLNGASRVGYGPLPTSTVNATRWPSGRAFLTPEVRALPNFELRTEAMATRVVFNGTRAVGVTYKTKDGTEHTAAAAKEVILSAGAFRSPQLLMLSGVGPARVLRNFSIPAVAVSEGVGRNLQDHLMTTVTYAVRKPSVPSGGYTLFPHGGFYYSQWCKERNCSYPDMQFMCGTEGPAAMCWNGLVGHIQYDPGFLTLKSTDPSVYPAIYMNYLGVQPQPDSPVPTGPYYDDYVPAMADIDRLAEGIQRAREIFEQNRSMFLFPISPTKKANLTDNVLDTAGTIYHPVGTCKMGPGSDALAVVDASLRVRGVQGLRVADASIMPLITNVNTDATSRLIGYHLGDMILAEGD